MGVYEQISYSTLVGLVEEMVRPGGVFPDLAEVTEKYLAGDLHSLTGVAGRAVSRMAQGAMNLFQGNAAPPAESATKRAAAPSPSEVFYSILKQVETLGKLEGKPRDVQLDHAWRILSVAQEAMRENGGRLGGEKAADKAKKVLSKVLHTDKLAKLGIPSTDQERGKQALHAINAAFDELKAQGFPDVPDLTPEATEEPPAAPRAAAPAHSSSSCTPNTLLLIDEIDVLFGEKFHGQTFDPCRVLQSTEIFELIEHVWDNRGGTVAKLRSTPACRRLLER